jgi:GTP diphosphokinase / guanosine-3',5'-bis(diphosphate) 3'-diphosphatase
MLSLKALKRLPGFELFFAPLDVELDPTTLEAIRFAYIMSKCGHYKQIRDDGGRYFDHPKSAAWIYINEFGGHDPRIIINALLHDIQEDTYLLSTYRTKLNFGKEIALDVRALTKLPKGKETFEEYLQRIVDRGAEIIFVKLCDRLHNVRSLGGRKKEKRLEQIVETKKYFFKLISILRSYGGEWIEMSKMMKKKMDEAIASYKLE